MDNRDNQKQQYTAAAVCICEFPLCTTRADFPRNDVVVSRSKKAFSCKRYTSDDGSEVFPSPPKILLIHPASHCKIYLYSSSRGVRVITYIHSLGRARSIVCRNFGDFFFRAPKRSRVGFFFVAGLWRSYKRCFTRTSFKKFRETKRLKFEHTKNRAST